MKELIHPADRYKMNWIEGNVEWGTVNAPEGLSVHIDRSTEEGILTERYIFTNESQHDIFTSLKDIAIYTPFNDDYTKSEICIKNRCHTHIWCGENISYIMALRMGGEEPHLGMVLVEGSLGGYSVERDISRISNDRGDFLLHPSPVALAPGETFVISWKLFWHSGKKDFYQKAAKYNPHFLEVQAKQFIYFDGEEVTFNIIPAFSVKEEEITIKKMGEVILFEMKDGYIFVKDIKPTQGEQKYQINVAGVHTHCCILVLPTLDELIKARCKYIIEKQQYHNSKSRLDGAFLIYDTEEGHCYYSTENDYNGGRERVGMGVLLAAYLQKYEDKEIENSLKKYMEYIEREIFDEATNLVCNDYQKDNSFKRLYNYPWMSTLYLELFDLWKDMSDIEKAYQIMKSFYIQGGAAFYAIDIPLERLLFSMKKVGMDKEYEELLEFFREHCETILKNGIIYPAHEVNFEQSIVAPAAHILLQMYRVTEDKIYLEGAERQIRVLELFNGLQPDYHMYQVAIRHWDGYWFGKKRMYGDTYPHYWSALTGNVYRDYAKIKGNKEYERNAEHVFRGVLSLFFPDGRASCAYVYPVTVNGETANYYDVYANDQDWGLYFMLKHVWRE